MVWKRGEALVEEMVWMKISHDNQNGQWRSGQIGRKKKLEILGFEFTATSKH